jgi:hypothetical protein
VHSILVPFNCKHSVFTRGEWRKIQTFLDEEGKLETGSAYREVVSWALQDIQSALLEDMAHGSAPSDPSDLIDLAEMQEPADVINWISTQAKVELDGTQKTNFTDHKISGRDLVRMDKDDLKELGLNMHQRLAILLHAVEISGAKRRRAPRSISEIQADEMMQQILRLRGTFGTLCALDGVPVCKLAHMIYFDLRSFSCL